MSRILEPFLRVHPRDVRVARRRIAQAKELIMTTTQPPTPAIACSVWFGPVVSPAEERDLIAHLVVKHGVGVCCWPRDTARVEHLAAANVPRLLLIGPDSIPPAPAPGQAWVRTTARNDEIHDALVGLCRSPRPEVRCSA